jgi:mono/diheme cytochrome c family protein
MSARLRLAGLALLSSVVLAGCSSFSRAEPPAPEAHVPATEDTFPSTHGVASVGGQIFAVACAACHGASGQGDLGPALAGSAAALDYSQVLQQVEEGRGAMPSFRPVLTHREIKEVSSYVVRFIGIPTSATPNIG